MTRSRSRLRCRIAATALAASASACIVGINPDYEERADQADTSNDADSSSESTDATTTQTSASETDTSSDETGSDETGSDDTGSDETGSDETGTQTQTTDILAEIAACRGDGDLSPDGCLNYAGPKRAAVELAGGPQADQQLVTCMKFPIDAALADSSLTQVTLELHTAPDVFAGSDSSGEIWQVGPFGPDTFAQTLPAKLGPMPVAQDIGPVLPNETVTWMLPLEIVVPGVFVRICLFPLSDDEVLYWGKHGDVPPILRVEYELQ